jgi:hypothetical protein
MMPSATGPAPPWTLPFADRLERDMRSPSGSAIVHVGDSSELRSRNGVGAPMEEYG